jgi:two-component system chemotaxis response regulator CheY
MFPNTTRFLVVDDMPTMRELVKVQLRSLGYRNVVEAGDGDEALSKVVLGYKNAEPIDFIISDWNMPKMNGLDFLKQIRASEKFRHLPFLLLTSESEKDQVTEAILAGVNQYIVKPFQPKAFEEKLKAIWIKLSKK